MSLLSWVPFYAKWHNLEEPNLTTPITADSLTHYDDFNTQAAAAVNKFAAVLNPGDDLVAALTAAAGAASSKITLHGSTFVATAPLLIPSNCEFICDGRTVTTIQKGFAADVPVLQNATDPSLGGNVNISLEGLTVDGMVDPIGAFFQWTFSSSTSQGTSNLPHGLSVGNPVTFKGLMGAAPLANNVTYYVKTVPTSTTATFAATLGGSQITITSNGGATNATTTPLIYIGRVYNARLTQVEATRSPGMGVQIDGAGYGSGNTLRHVILDGVYGTKCRGRGVSINHAARNVDCLHVEAEGCDGDGVWLDVSEMMTTRVHARDNRGHGILVRNTHSSNYAGLYAEINDQCGIHVVGQTSGQGSNWQAAGNGQNMPTIPRTDVPAVVGADLYFSADPTYSYGVTSQAQVDGLYLSGKTSRLGGGAAPWSIYVEDGTEIAAAGIVTDQNYGGTDTHTATTTSGSPVVPDASFSIYTHAGRQVTHPNITGKVYAGPSSIDGVSIRLSSDPRIQVDVNATGSGSGSLVYSANVPAVDDLKLMVASYGEGGSKGNVRLPSKTQAPRLVLLDTSMRSGHLRLSRGIAEGFGARRLYLPGTTGVNVSCPNSGIPATGSVSVSFEFAAALASWTPGTAQVIASIWNAAGNDKVFAITITTAGALNLSYSTDGSTTSSKSVDITPFVQNGVEQAFRIDFDMSTGAAMFFKGAGRGNWERLALVAGAGSPITWHKSSVLPLLLGDINNASTVGVPMVGTLAYFTMKIGGVFDSTHNTYSGSTLIAAADFTEQVTGPYRDRAGRSWTFNGDGMAWTDVETATDLLSGTVDAIPVSTSLADLGKLTSTVTVGPSSGADTQLWQSSLVAASRLAVGQRYRMVTDGNIDNKATSGTFTMRLHVNATTIAETITAIQSQTSLATGTVWRTEFEVEIIATGAGGSVLVYGVLYAPPAAASQPWTTRVYLATTSVDLSTGLQLATYGQIGTSDAANTLRALGGYARQIA